MITGVLTVELLRGIFDFDFLRGRMIWRVPKENRRDLIGKEAGGAIRGESGADYWYVRVYGELYKRADLIYFVYHGEWARPTVDHADRNSLNDSISNLRPANSAEQARNRRTKKERVGAQRGMPMGVRKLESGRFQASLFVDGAKLQIGTFDTVEEAQKAYIRKRMQHFREFA